MLMLFRKWSSLLWLLTFVAGALAGRLAPRPTSVRPDPRAEHLEARLSQRLETARLRAVVHPGWDSRRELLRVLCELRELELEGSTKQGIHRARLEQLQPTPQQEALLDSLWHEAHTARQRKVCEQLEYRTYQMLVYTYAPPDEADAAGQ